MILEILASAILSKYNFIFYRNEAILCQLVGIGKVGQGTDGGGIYGDYAAAVAESLH